MKKYVDSCRTLEILKQDSGLLPKPTESWNTFEPQIGDLAYISEEKAEYEFDGADWIKKEVSSQKEAIEARKKELETRIAAIKEKKEQRKAQILAKRAQVMSLRKQNKKSVEE